MDAAKVLRVLERHVALGERQADLVGDPAKEDDFQGQP
jgi:hypothetical protein